MIPPINNLNICYAQIDWRKCPDDSSNQKFEYFGAQIDWRKCFAKSSDQKIAQIDWRKCFEKSFEQEFEYFL